MIAHLVGWIQARGLRSPAILFLEAHKPLAPIGSQVLLFLQPLLRFVGPLLGWYALLLEDPANVERVLSHLEHCLAD